MFLAMTFSLPVYFGYQLFLPEKDRFYPPSRIYWLMAIPASFDLVGTALAKVGLMYCTVSVYQLVRCTVIIITALLKVFALKERLSKHMWLGVLINLVAMIMVSSTTFLQPAEPGARDPRLGVLFILLSCLVQGTQYVFEEKVMSVEGAPPLVVVGMEGLWGTLLMLIIVFPIAYVLPGEDKGSLENFYDSLVMVSNSTEIQIVLAAFFVTVAFYNIFAIYVTHFLSSIWHAILDNFRPVSVWGTDLLLFYVFTGGRFGEVWTEWSWLQLGGMMVLFLGTAVYNGSVPGLYWSDYEVLDHDEMSPASSSSRDHPNRIIKTKDGMSTPSLMRSPILTQSIEDSGGVLRTPKLAQRSRAGSDGFSSTNIQYDFESGEHRNY